MAKQAASIIVRRSRDGLVVQATGQTPRGQKFIKAQHPLKVKSIRSKEFKSEMAAAVAKLLDSEA